MAVDAATIAEMRALAARGISQAEIGEMYGVRRGVVQWAIGENAERDDDEHRGEQSVWLRVAEIIDAGRPRCAFCWGESKRAHDRSCPTLPRTRVLRLAAP